MNVRALVVDDERLARNRLKRLLADLQVDVVAEGQDGNQAVELVNTGEIDIVFMDINMPNLNGLEAARLISETMSEPPAIVFCTAYDEYAVKAFDTSAVAYLLKPINTADLQRVLEQASSTCLLYTSTSPRDKRQSRMPSSA